MRKKSTVISGIGCACLAITVIVYGATPRAHVSVKKSLEVSFRELPAAFVDVHNVGTADKSTEGEPWRAYLESVIDETLKKTGGSQTFDETKAEVLVKCTYGYGGCLPYLGRHLGDVFWSSINWINLTVIDRKSGAVLGEVEFRRPLLATRPTDDLIERMFEGMAVKEASRPDKKGQTIMFDSAEKPLGASGRMN